MTHIFQQSCSDHQRDIVYNRCHLLTKAISNLKEILSTLIGNSHITNGNILMPLNRGIDIFLLANKYICSVGKLVKMKYLS